MCVGDVVTGLLARQISPVRKFKDSKRPCLKKNKRRGEQYPRNTQGCSLTTTYVCIHTHMCASTFIHR